MRARGLRILGCTAALALACALSACASNGGVAPSPELLASQPSPLKSASVPVDAPTDAADLPDGASEISDPFEKMNRSVFEGNQRFNHAVAYPAARAYHETVPEPVRNSVRNFAENLTEPVVFANDLLQLRLGAAATTAGRFAMNSTIGIGGLFDPASKQKLGRQTGDFGQTLYVWGMRNTNYLVVPIIGPTNVRDLIGATVDFVANIPAGSLLQTGLAATQFAAQAATTTNGLTVAGSIATPVTKLDEVQQMQVLEDSSLDFYTMLRSVVEQKRQAELEEALATSGWTASRNNEAVASTPESKRPGPVSSIGANERELLATVPISVQ
jgi:phospholipid-binding lipoprotein MlaA